MNQMQEIIKKKADKLNFSNLGDIMTLYSNSNMM